ncbi:MAG: hypothetical protein M3Z85_06245, partial [Acidobacteriota bacterium]|nr:hypothetical protein [Acidobacteriota bacterium]
MEKRKSQRFRLALPVEITHFQGKRMSRAAKTREIGSGGLTFSTEREVTPGGCMEFVTTLMDGKRVVRIRCKGVVLRVHKEHIDGTDSFQVTVTIDRYEFLRSPQ